MNLTKLYPLITIMISTSV